SLTDDIGDEVLPNISIDEDSAESLVPEEPQSTSEDGSPPRERDVQGMTGEDLWELSPGHLGGAQSKKRPSSVDGEATMATEKRSRPSLNSTIEMNIDDERITVSAFFKLFNLDFVIHNPRQSILPGKMECFGAKLKESSNFFRKRSKAQSDEMKEALYSNLRQANLDEQQKLREKTEEADGMLRSLDDCIRELEAELESVTTELADKERVNEWKVAERRANSHVYSFLYESMCLEVVFHTRAGEKSACHARLVHTLLSEFHEGRSDWLEKYPSKRCVPKLLHDVSLVVSRCRLLGEEVRLLRTWGSLKFDILDIACVDTSVRIVFSSLEAMAMFELSLPVTKDYPCCPLQMQHFKSHIGSTTAHRIEEVVSSVSPGKNYLTKIVKAIHTALLS
ncbi:hypothetical protein CRUP_000244, partial [Coryphaenoides rupestris]